MWGTGVPRSNTPFVGSHTHCGGCASRQNGVRAHRTTPDKLTGATTRGSSIVDPNDRKTGPVDGIAQLCSRPRSTLKRSPRRLPAPGIRVRG